jgi:nitroreductase
MEFEDVVRKRKKIRKYLPDKIPDRIISKLITNASRAPSAATVRCRSLSL